MTKKEMNREHITEERRVTIALIAKTDKLLKNLNEYKTHLDGLLAKP